MGHIYVNVSGNVDCRLEGSFDADVPMSERYDIALASAERTRLRCGHHLGQVTGRDYDGGRSTAEAARLTRTICAAPKLVVCAQNGLAAGVGVDGRT